jgi:four helix bundle protein
MSNSFQELLAWQAAHTFVLEVYKTTALFPKHERFALSPQFERAAVSIAANIAEGYRKMSKADKLRFMNIAQGSLEECRYYIILSHDISYIDDERFCILNNLIENASRLLNAYCKKIKDSSFNASMD